MNRRHFLLNKAMFGSACLLSSPLFSGQGNPPESSPASDDPLSGGANGPWRRLFLDATVVEESSGLARAFHAAKKREAPVIVQDRVWEGTAAITGPYVYGTVLHEEGRFRLWYQFLKQGNHVGYAESHDGVHWTKPNLGIIEYDGSRENNMVVSAFDPVASGGGLCHNPSVIRNPHPESPEEKFLLCGFDTHHGHARIAYSPDGLRWTYPEISKKSPLFTSSDVANFCYDPYESRYFATWKTRNRRGRAVGVVWSTDGKHWTKPFNGPVFVADDLDPDDTQIYGMPAFPYQGLYIGLPWIYNSRYFRYGEYNVEKLYDAQADSPRTMDVQLAWSWDLINWTRPPGREQFIPRGEAGAWDSGMIVTARAPVQASDELYFYYGGCEGLHDDKRVQAAIGLATLRLDGFCSMQTAGDTEGWLISRREPFRTPKVTINARTEAGGYVVAEILDQQNRPLPGFTRNDCMAFSGDSVRHQLSWKTDQFAEGQVKSDYKLRFFLMNAELYSYLPQDLDPAQPDLARFPQAGP